MKEPTMERLEHYKKLRDISVSHLADCKPRTYEHRILCQLAERYQKEIERMEKEMNI